MPIWMKRDLERMGTQVSLKVREGPLYCFTTDTCLYELLVCAIEEAKEGK